MEEADHVVLGPLVDRVAGVAVGDDERHHFREGCAHLDCLHLGPGDHDLLGGDLIEGEDPAHHEPMLLGQRAPLLPELDDRHELVLGKRGLLPAEELHPQRSDELGRRPRKNRTTGRLARVSRHTGTTTARATASARFRARFFGVISPMRRRRTVRTTVATSPVTYGGSVGGGGEGRGGWPGSRPPRSRGCCRRQGR